MSDMGDTKVRLRIIACMTDAQGDRHETKNARTGVLRRVEDGVEMEYEDMQDGVRAHVALKLAANRARMRRTGEMTGTLHFTPGARQNGTYATAYGEIPVAVFTHRVALREHAQGGEALLDYDIFIGGEKTGSAQMRITWRL